jgi:hypothetical protein
MSDNPVYKFTLGPPPEEVLKRIMSYRRWDNLRNELRKLPGLKPDECIVMHDVPRSDVGGARSAISQYAQQEGVKIQTRYKDSCLFIGIL